MNKKPIDREDDGTCDRSGEELLHDCCRELGVNMAMALQIVAWAEENFARTKVCDADGDQLRRLNNMNQKAWLLLIDYQAKQKTVADMIMSTRTMALELGYTTAAGADNVATLARILGMDKQTVNKCAAVFQTKLGLPPRPGQRCEAARANMTEARSKQLGKTNDDGEPSRRRRTQNSA